MKEALQVNGHTYVGGFFAKNLIRKLLTLQLAWHNLNRRPTVPKQPIRTGYPKIINSIVREVILRSRTAHSDERRIRHRPKQVARSDTMSLRLVVAAHRSNPRGNVSISLDNET